MKSSWAKIIALALVAGLAFSCTTNSKKTVQIQSQELLFTADWNFVLIDSTENPLAPDKQWRQLNLPHDWSIEGPFSETHPATYNGGALPGGIGLYKKEFQLPESDSSKNIFIRFDGVFMNSEVWINGQYLGKRPYGYIGFEYDLSPHLNFGEQTNTLIVKVDNSVQPNSRWYSGSGIYRNVYLVKKGEVFINQWGIYVTTPVITEDSAIVVVETDITNASSNNISVKLKHHLYAVNAAKSTYISTVKLTPGESKTVRNEFALPTPKLWSIETPNLYQLNTSIIADSGILDQQLTTVGLRTIRFDTLDGFFLNGESIKIKGVCNHHDLGPLGAAINKSALERQLDILRGMGVNAIRTAHNPPAPELLQLCDEKGFLVMDEAFDEWKKKKVKYGYGLHFEEWYERDLRDFMKRDRNHPSIVIWSVGNEILEQWDSTGISLTKKIVDIARSMDATRPITTANNPPMPHNYLNVPDVVDVIGYNYAHSSYEKHPEVFPNRPFIATETNSALATRGYYDEKSDTIKRWPVRWDILFTDGNPGNTVSSYDQVSTPWGSTHEETWKIIKNNPFMSGMFIWTGFDYLGEPTPYVWPSRSSYFGVIDLAGFPKDAYYMYKSEWTDEAVLHIFPHWTWKDRKEVDIWAYYSLADEVELFLNGQSLGTRQKGADEFHVMWRVPYEPGELKAISRKGGQEVLVKTIKTAKAPASILLESDRETLNFEEQEFSFITASVIDEDGTLVPDATNSIRFEVEGAGYLRAVGNGDPTSHESFQSNERKAFYGKCLLIVAPNQANGKIQISATSRALQSNTITLTTN